MDAFVPSESDWLEVNARLSAQRFLLEQLYANAFLGNPDGFDDFMAGLVELGRTRAYTTEPMEADAKLEMQARIATHMQKFHSAVATRLKQG